MNNGLKKCGAPSAEELMQLKSIPDMQRIEKGPVVFIECLECIPCNPCENACPKGAITVGEQITNLPQIDFEKCIGCGICIAACPGQAIYVKNFKHGENTASLSLPFEYYPLPKAGDEVLLLGRTGKPVCKGCVLSVSTPKTYDHTAVIKVEYDRTFFDEVITISKDIG